MALTPQFPAPTGVPTSTVQSRRALAGLVVRDTAGLPRAGVLPRHAGALVSARASLGVDVAAFEAVLVRNGLPGFIANDGTVTVPLAAAPSSNSRIDLVWVKQNESEAPFSDASADPVFGVTAGTAAASPTAPSAPAGALPLAQVLIPSTATTSQSAGVVVTQVFPYTAMSGGAVMLRNQTEMNAWSPLDSALAYRMDGGGGIYVRDGGAWSPLGDGDSGWQSVTVFGSGFNPYTDLGWDGVKYRVKGGVVYVNGAAINSGAWTAGTAICNIPAGARPSMQWQGANCSVTTSGDVQVGSTGGPGGVSFSATYPLG